MNTTQLSKIIQDTLDENKAIDITVLNVEHITEITDQVIVCSAISKRHAAALADKLIRTVKDNGIRPYGSEGKEQGEWILIDLQDIIVHIMLPESRDFYSLEKLWTVTEELRESK